MCIGPLQGCAHHDVREGRKGGVPQGLRHHCPRQWGLAGTLIHSYTIDVWCALYWLQNKVKKN